VSSALTASFYIMLYGGISLYAEGILDQPSEKALIAELSAMNARM
jgi:hypothetical protein